MKKDKIFKITLLTLTSVMVACGDITPSISPSTGNSDIPTTSTNPTTTATPQLIRLLQTHQQHLMNTLKLQ